MPRKLTQLRITRVALVPQGANPEADILLYKYQEPPDGAGGARGEHVLPDGTDAQAVLKEDDETEQPLSTADIILRQEAMEQLCRLKWALYDSMASIFEHASVEEQPELLLTSVQEFAAFARQAIAQLDANALAKAAPSLAELDAVVKAGKKISRARMERLKAAMTALEAIIAEGEPGMAEKPEAVEKRLGDLEGELTVLKQAHAGLTAENTMLKQQKAQLETELQAEKDAKDPDAMWKGVNPQIRKMYEEQQKRIEEAEKVAKAERESRERHECIQKALSFKHLGLNPDDDWELFKVLGEVSPPKAARFEQVLKAADEALRQSKLFAELGKSDSGEHTGTAWATIQVRAKELIAKGLAKTEAAAIDQVVQHDPTLYHQYETERRGM